MYMIIHVKTELKPVKVKAKLQFVVYVNCTTNSLHDCGSIKINELKTSFNRYFNKVNVQCMCQREYICTLSEVYSVHFCTVLIAKNLTNVLAEMLLLILKCGMINKDSHDIFSNLFFFCLKIYELYLYE